MTAPQYLAGRLLLAMPGMGDPRFDHAVIALCVHDAEGALGIGVGRIKHGLRLHELLEDIGIAPGMAPDCVIHDGGPVEPQRGFVLHSPDWDGPGTILAGPLGALSASLDVLKAIAAGDGPERWIVALGYAGWGAGQLDGEMQRHGWYAAAGRPDIVFDTPVTARWKAAWLAEGVDPALLSSTTGHA